MTKAQRVKLLKLRQEKANLNNKCEIVDNKIKKLKTLCKHEEKRESYCYGPPTWSCVDCDQRFDEP